MVYVRICNLRARANAGKNNKAYKYAHPLIVFMVSNDHPSLSIIILLLLFMVYPPYIKVMVSVRIIHIRRHTHIYILLSIFYLLIVVRYRAIAF